MKKVINNLSLMSILAVSAFAFNSCGTQPASGCATGCKKACCGAKACKSGCAKACCTKKKTCATGCAKACCTKKS